MRRFHLPLHETLIVRMGCDPDTQEILDCGEGIGERVVLTYRPHDHKNGKHRSARNESYRKKKEKVNARCGVCRKLISPDARYCMKHAQRGNSKEGA